MGLGNPSGGGGGGGSGAIRAGRAFVELFLDDNKLYRGLEAVKSKLSGAGNFFAKTGAAVAGAGAAVFGPLAGIFTESVYHLDELNKAAERLGTSTESLSKLGFAAKFAGLELEDVEASAKFLEKNISEAAQGSDEAKKKFTQLGLSAKDLMKLPLDEQFLAIGDAIDGLANPADKINVALDTMGKAGSKLLPLFKGGLLRERFGQAEKGGFVTSQAKADEATKFVDSMTLITTSIKKTIGSLGMSLFPVIKVFEQLALKFFDVAAAARKFIKENIAIVSIAAGIGAALIVAGTALIGFGLAFKVAAIAVGVGISAMKLAAAAVLALATPLGLVIAAVAGLGAIFLTQTESGRQFTSEMQQGMIEFGETVQTTFAGMNDAMNAGDFGLAFKIAVTGMQLEWAKVVAFWTDKWNAFKGVFVDGWSAAVTLIAIILSRSAAGWEIIFERLGEKIGNSFRYIADIILEAAERMAVALDSLDPTDSLKGAIELIQGLRAQTSEAVRDAVRAQSDKKVEEIKQRQIALEKELMQAHSKEQKARDEARAADAASAREEIARLEEKLRALRESAKANTSTGSPLFGPILGIMAAVGKAVPKPSEVFGASKGGFSTPYAAQQFGIGDTVQKQVALATKATAVNTAETAKNVLTLINALRWK